MPTYDKTLPIEPAKPPRQRRKPRPCIGWRYTPDEEYDIERAIRLAKVFMMRYGKGSRPQLINKSHYAQND